MKKYSVVLLNLNTNKLFTVVIKAINLEALMLTIEETYPNCMIDKYEEILWNLKRYSYIAFNTLIQKIKQILNYHLI